MAFSPISEADRDQHFFQAAADEELLLTARHIREMDAAGLKEVARHPKRVGRISDLATYNALVQMGMTTGMDPSEVPGMTEFNKNLGDEIRAGLHAIHRDAKAFLDQTEPTEIQ